MERKITDDIRFKNILINAKWCEKKHIYKASGDSMTITRTVSRKKGYSQIFIYVPSYFKTKFGEYIVFGECDGLLVFKAANETKGYKLAKNSHGDTYKMAMILKDDKQFLLDYVGVHTIHYDNDLKIAYVYKNEEEGNE